MQLDEREKADLTTIEKVVLMVCNQPCVMIMETFGDRHISYLEDQQHIMMSNFCKWWSGLDVEHRVRAVNTSDNYYSNEAKKRIDSY